MLLAGLLAALIGNILIGAGQTLQKFALNRLSDRPVKPTLPTSGRRTLRSRASSHGHFETHNPKLSRPRYKDRAWLAGIALNYIGEICGNWLALSLASAAVVTPLGISSVVVNAVLAQRFLGEVIGPVQRRGYYSIMLGVLLIIISAPRRDDEDTAGLTRAVSMLSTGAFSTFVALAMTFLIVLIYVAYVRNNDSVELLVLIVSVFGAISVVSSKSLGTIARLGVANAALPLQEAAAPNGLGDVLNDVVVNGTQLLQPHPHPHYKPRPPPLSESVSSTVIFLVLSLLGQEFFKQQLLSRFPLTRFQPIHYATFNTLSVIASIILFGELQGAGFAAGAKFFAGFFVGMAVVVYGSLLIGSVQGEEQPTPGGPLASLIPSDILFAESPPEKEQAD